MSATPFRVTVTIIEDPAYPEVRNYSLVDREFFLKDGYPEAIEAEATWLDGTKFKEKYYVIDLKEYMRVVPEARNENHNWTNDVLLPLHLCHKSFKPTYAK